VLYGVEGIGKSTFANEAEAVFIPTEDGLARIDVKAGSFPVCKSLEEVYKALADLATAKKGTVKAVCIDTADWLEKLITESICKKDGCESIVQARGGYGKGFIAIVEEWYKIFTALDYLNNDLGMAIIILAHSRVNTFLNPLGEDYDRYTLTLHDSKSVSSANKLVEWADAVLFVNYETITKEGKDNKTRGTGQGKRKMYTEERPGYRAKNRFDLPDTMNFNWSELQKEISK